MSARRYRTGLILSPTFCYILESNLLSKINAPLHSLRLYQQIPWHQPKNWRYLPSPPQKP
jgi:hypothetical protein